MVAKRTRRNARSSKARARSKPASSRKRTARVKSKRATTVSKAAKASVRRRSDGRGASTPKTSRTKTKVATFPARALAGRGSAGKSFNLSAPVEARAAALVEAHEPRPYVSRYPISNEEFEALKAAAP